MTQPTVQLFVNPLAGSWSQPKVAALTHAFEAAGARVILSQSSAEPLAIAPDADHICAVGGDGTLRHVAAAIARAGRPLTMSIYPAGTVNLVGRECAYPVDPVTFVERVLHDSPPRRHHIGMIGDTALFSCASVGPDSFAVAGLSPSLKQAIGRAAYVASFLKLLARWPRPQLRVVTGDREIACEAVYVAKGRFFAGPWSFAPTAALDQPLFHVVALRHATRRDFLYFVWLLWRRQPLADHANIVILSCTELEIEGANLPLQADGDIVAHLPVQISLSPKTLSFA